MFPKATTDTFQELASGTRVGKYEIVRKLASGGMAEIYLASVSGIQGFRKHVVLKRILPELAANEDFVKMFLREARVAATLDHGNIAHVHDIGELEGGYFYAMEYLHGEDLRTIMRTLSSRKEKLPLEHALSVGLGVAAGLHYAHEMKDGNGASLGIVHRDISPSNIVVTFNGEAKVVDFGIAKIGADPDLSRSHAPKGKVSYMSPEQLEGRPVDRRSDVYSLGVVLYELTTHKRLFTGKSDFEVMRAVLAGPVPPPSRQHPGYPVDLESIIMHAVEHDPARRYPNARELERDLEAFVRMQRLAASTTAFAEWMATTFGPKREAWYPPPPPGKHDDPAAHASLTPEPVDVTRRVSREDLIEVTRRANGDDGAIFVSSQSNPSATGLVSGTSRADHDDGRTPPRGRRALGTAVGLGLVGLSLAVVAVGVLLWRGRTAAAVAQAAPAADNAVVMLVAEGGNVAVERPVAPPTAAPTPAPAPLPATATATAAPLAAPSPGRAPARNVSRSTGPNAASLSSSLVRRERDIRACLERNRSIAAGAPQISFHFQIRPDGRVTEVSVLPASVASTPLGACLREVGKHTTFPPQPEPVSFRIPLSLRVPQPVERRR